MKSAKTIERMFKGFYALNVADVDTPEAHTHTYHLYRDRYQAEVRIHICLRIAKEAPTDPRLRREWLQAKELLKALQALPIYE